MSVSDLRKLATNKRRYAILLVSYARERLLRAKRAIALNEEHVDLIVSVAKLNALHYLLQASACRSDACDLMAQYRARLAYGRSCCDTCDGLGRGHDADGTWICSPCMGIGQIRMVA